MIYQIIDGCDLIAEASIQILMQRCIGVPTFIITLCMSLDEAELVTIVESHICVLCLYGLEISILAWRQIRQCLRFESEIGNSISYAYFDSEDEPKYILTPAEM